MGMWKESLAKPHIYLVVCVFLILSSQWILPPASDYESTDFTCLLVWEFISCSPQPALILFDVIQPHTKLFSQLTCFLLQGEMQFHFDQNTLVSFLYPQRKWHFTNVNSSMLHGSSYAQKEAEFFLLGETFSAAQICQRHAIWQEKPWKVIQVCRVVSSQWPSPTRSGKTLWAERRCEKTQLSSRVYGLKSVNMQRRKGFIRTPQRVQSLCYHRCVEKS